MTLKLKQILDWSKTAQQGAQPQSSLRLQNVVRQLEGKDAQIKITEAHLASSAQENQFKKYNDTIYNKTVKSVPKASMAAINLFEESGIAKLVDKKLLTQKDVNDAIAQLEEKAKLTPNISYLGQIGQYGTLTGTWEEWHAGVQNPKDVQTQALKTRASMSSVETLTDLERQINRARREKLGQHLAEIGNVKINDSLRRGYYETLYREQGGEQAANLRQAFDTLALQRVADMYQQGLEAAKEFRQQEDKEALRFGEKAVRKLYDLEKYSPFDGRALDSPFDGRALDNATARYCASTPPVGTDVDVLMRNVFLKSGGVVGDVADNAEELCRDTIQLGLARAPAERSRYVFNPPEPSGFISALRSLLAALPAVNRVLLPDWLTTDLRWDQWQSVDPDLLFWAVPIARAAYESGWDTDALGRIPYPILAVGVLNSVRSLYEDENSVDPFGIFLRILDQGTVRFESLKAQMLRINNAAPDGVWWGFTKCGNANANSMNCAVMQNAGVYTALASMYHIVDQLDRRLAWLKTFETVTETFAAGNNEQIKYYKDLAEAVDKTSAMMTIVKYNFRRIAREMLQSPDDAMQELLFANTIATDTVNNVLMDETRQRIFKENKTWWERLRGQTGYVPTLGDWLGIRSVFAVGSVPFDTMGGVPPLSAAVGT